MWNFVAWWTSAHAECAVRTGADDLAVALDAAEAAYATLDPDEFARAVTEVDFVVPCLAEPLEPALVAQLHRVRGLGEYADGDEEGASASLLAAKGVAPDYTFPVELLPEGFELRTTYEALRPDAGPSERLPRPRDGELRIDGAPSRLRPTDRAALVQWLGEDRALTAYLAPADAPPSYPGIHKRRTRLFFVSAGAAAAAAAFYGASWASRGELERAETTWTEDRLKGIQARTNALLGVSLGLVGVGAVSLRLAVGAE